MKTWEPILDGEVAEAAWQSIAEIAEALTQPLPSRYAEADPNHPSLASGTSGRALFYAYRSRGPRPQPTDQEHAANLLDGATEALATMPLPPDLYGGFTGVAWTAQHLYSDRFADPGDAEGGPPAGNGTEQTAAAAAKAGGGEGLEEDGDPLVEIDGALSGFLEHTPWYGDYDLIRGLSGLGVYLLERLPRASALTCVERLLDRMEEKAEHKPEGVTWHTSPELLPDWQRAIYKDGYYNLGMAHGVPGAIAMLAAISASTARMAAMPAMPAMAAMPAMPAMAAMAAMPATAATAPAAQIAATAATAAAAPGRQAPLADRAAQVSRRAHALTRGAVEWLQAQQLSGETSWFGTAIAEGVDNRRSRVAWCYGDPGIAAALLVAARACGEPSWEKFATDMMLNAAARPEAESGVRDAGLCHGSAGLAHLFNRFYQETGEPSLRQASRFWYEWTLKFRRPGRGIAGYQSFEVLEGETEPTWRNEPGFLDGVTGIGLALLAGLSPFEPAWDRTLLLSAVTDPTVTG